MSDDEGILNLAVGILIGAFLTYIILQKVRPEQSPATPAMQVMYIPYPSPVPSIQVTAPPVPDKVRVQTAEPEPLPPVIPVPPVFPPAKDEKTMTVTKDKRGKLSLVVADRKV